MIIIPTRQCNTDNCNYCNVFKTDLGDLYFNKFNLDDFYEKILILCEKTNDYELRFFGGEPFIKIDIIIKIIDFFFKKNKKFRFTINTNLSLLEESILSFLKTHNVKLIISCNGDTQTHSSSRGISISETIRLYSNIKKVISIGIENQINIVVDDNNVNLLQHNIYFLVNTLGASKINLLPSAYNGWNASGIATFEEQLNNIEKNKGDKIDFINKNFVNDVLLFNSEIVIDSDGKVYPNMVIIEKFFTEEKKQILLSDLNLDYTRFKDDINMYDEETKGIYNKFINMTLAKKSASTIDGDRKIMEIFHKFLINY